MERTNKVYIVGTLKDLPTDRQRTGEKDGVKWIGGTAIIESGDNEIEVKFYSLEKTQEGKANKRYPNYVALPQMVGQRVKVNGELTGRVFYNAGQGQITAFNEITAGFFNSAKPDDKDVATFEYSGFVTKPLHERRNKNEELIGYEIEIAQANYRQDNMQIFKFMVDPKKEKIRSAIENSYTKNTTVYVTGDIRHEVFMDEVEEEVDFGDPIVKLYRNVRKSYLITGGKRPIVEDGMAYTQDQIQKLQSAYQDMLEDIEKEAKAENSGSKSEPAKTDNTSRLL